MFGMNNVRNSFVSLGFISYTLSVAQTTCQGCPAGKSFGSRTLGGKLSKSQAVIIISSLFEVFLFLFIQIQGGSNMTGTDLCVNKPVTVPVIFEPPCTIGKFQLFMSLLALVKGKVHPCTGTEVR